MQTLQGIYAHLDCRDLDASEGWFTALFGRGPDTRPMQGLIEWAHGENGLQVFHDAGRAGRGTLLLIVGDLEAERARLDKTGLSPGAVEPGGGGTICRLADPDGNRVVLAQPGR